MIDRKKNKKIFNKIINHLFNFLTKVCMFLQKSLNTHIQKKKTRKNFEKKILEEF